MIQACLELHQPYVEYGGDPNAIDYIEIIGNPLLRQRTDRANPRTGRESQVSGQHAVGVCLLRGKAGLPEFSDASVMDSSIQKIGAKLKFVDDPSLAVESVKINLKYKNNPVISKDIKFAKGSLQDPLSDQDLEQKLRDLVIYGKPSFHPDALIEKIWSLEKLDDIRQLIDLLN